MLHRIPSRQPVHVLLVVACACGALLSLGFSVFYAVYAPNWDVPLLCSALFLLLLWPLAVLLVQVFGEQVIQVEHAGVVVSRYLWGMRLSRRVIPAARMLRFDWSPAGDSLFALRLVIQRPDGTAGYTTVLYTASAYALATVLRDLELHYPGSGLYESVPGADGAPMRISRFLSVVCILTGCAALWACSSRFLTPLRVAAGGQFSRAAVCALVWGNQRPEQQSSYRMLVLPDGAAEPVLTASAFSGRTTSIPQVGQSLSVLWKPGEVCYLPGEVAVFVLPLPGVSICCLLVWFGIWGLMRSSHRLR